MALTARRLAELNRQSFRQLRAWAEGTRPRPNPEDVRLRLLGLIERLVVRAGRAVADTARDVFGRGDVFVEKITRRVDRPLQQNAMVVILSRDALDSRHVLSEIQYALGEKRFRGRLVGVLAGQTAANSIPWALDVPVDARKDPAKAARQVARLLEGKGKRALVRGEAVRVGRFSLIPRRTGSSPPASQGS